LISIGPVANPVANNSHSVEPQSALGGRHAAVADACSAYLTGLAAASVGSHGGCDDATFGCMMVRLEPYCGDAATPGPAHRLIFNGCAAKRRERINQPRGRRRGAPHARNAASPNPPSPKRLIAALPLATPADLDDPDKTILAALPRRLPPSPRVWYLNLLLKF
jgi:hypothetical protein